MKACILVGTHTDDAPKVAAALAALDGVRASFAVLGRPEVVLRCEVVDLTALGRLLSSASATEGVLVSETLLEIPEGAIR
ncbi:MAG: Lrp/AsnC ligand binding domain-containing protein [Methanobacteriota archaeon]